MSAYSFLVPPPEVDISINPSVPTVGEPLTLTCTVTTVRGITSRVDIIWRIRDDAELNRTNNTSPTMMTTSPMYTDTYAISLLTTDDDDVEYQCEVVINTSPPVMDNDTFRLDVTGKEICAIIFSIMSVTIVIIISSLVA